jgi:hypothetical protein
MLLSSITSSTLAAVGTLGIVLAGRYSDVIRNMREVVPGAPQLLIDGLYAAIPNFRNFDFKSRAAYGDPIPGDVLGWAALYAAAYLAVLLSLGIVVFRRRDLQ